MSDSENPTHYRVVGEVGGCRHKHRTPEAAVRCEIAIDRSIARMYGRGSCGRGRASAVYADGSSERIEWHRDAYNQPVLGPDPAFVDLED